MRRRLSLILLCAWLVDCQAGGDTALGVAQRFVDEHYVRINLEAAKGYCAGLALQKVQSEQDLTRGQVIDESTRQPTVHYNLLETKPDGDDRVSFLFEGKIRVEDADPFTRKWLVTTKREAALWRVSNYQEFE